MKTVIKSILIGIVATFTIGFGKLFFVDKPQFDSFLKECFSMPLCDPNPYIPIGFPLQFGRYSDVGDSSYINNWLGLAVNLIFWSLLAWATISAFKMIMSRYKTRPVT